MLQVLLDHIDIDPPAIGEAAHAIGAVAAMRFGHVQRHVDHIDHAFPCQHLRADGQRERRKADRHVHRDLHAAMVDDDGVDAGQDAPGHFIHAPVRHGGQEGEEFLAAPTHDHVGLAQDLGQAGRDRGQHRVAGGVAVGVVDVLEVVDVEQEQRPNSVRVIAGRDRRRRRQRAHVLEEVAAVVQAGERIAHALLLEFAVLFVQLRVGMAYLPVQEAHHDRRQCKGHREEPPHPLLQAAVVDLGRFERVFAAQQLDLALFLVGLVLLLQLEHRLLATLFEQFVRELALAVIGIEGAAQIIHALERFAIFDQRRLQFGLVAHLFVAGDAGLDLALALGHAPGREQGLTQVQLGDRIEPAVVQGPRRLDRLLRVRDGPAVVPHLEVAVRQVDQGARNALGRAHLALERQAVL